MKLKKYLILFGSGGVVYSLIEILFRGRTHWSMFILGGLSLILIGLLNETFPWEMPLVVQMLLGGLMITCLELLTGYIVNIKLGWNIWDYSNTPFNFKGQICACFSLLWCLLSVIGIVLDDWLRYWLFHEEFPTYKWFTINTREE